MGPDDRLADGEPEPYANNRALAVAAMKLVEQARRVAGGQAWAVVIDHYPYGLALGDGRNIHVRTGRRVFGNVVEQVDEHLHDQLGIHDNGRQISGQAHVDHMVGQLPVQRCPHQVIERFHFRAQHNLTGFESHQVQDVGYQVRHLARFHLDGTRKRNAGCLIQRSATLCERAAGSSHYGQWGPQVMGYGGE